MATSAVNDQTQFWTPKEVANYFRTTSGSVLKWVRGKKVEATVTPSGRFLIPVREVERLKASSFKPEDFTAEEMKQRLEAREARRLAAIERIKNFKAKAKEEREKCQRQK